MANGLFRALELWLAPGAGTEDAYDPASLAVIRVDTPRTSRQPSEEKTATAHDNEAVTGRHHPAPSSIMTTTLQNIAVKLPVFARLHSRQNAYTLACTCTHMREDVHTCTHMYIHHTNFDTCKQLELTLTHTHSHACSLTTTNDPCPPLVQISFQLGVTMAFSGCSCLPRVVSTLHTFCWRRS